MILPILYHPRHKQDLIEYSFLDCFHNVRPPPHPSLTICKKKDHFWNNCLILRIVHMPNSLGAWTVLTCELVHLGACCQSACLPPPWCQSQKAWTRSKLAFPERLVSSASASRRCSRFRVRTVLPCHLSHPCCGGHDQREKLGPDSEPAIFLTSMIAGKKLDSALYGCGPKILM